MLLIVELLFIVLLAMILFMLYRSEKVAGKQLTPTAQIEEYWTCNERRQSVRFKKDLSVNYMVEKKAHLKSNGRAVDISEGGAKLLLDQKLAQGTILDLKISGHDLDKILEIEGEVVWSEESKEKNPAAGKRLFHTGLKFLGIRSPAGIKVSDFIRSLCTGES